MHVFIFSLFWPLGHTTGCVCVFWIVMSWDNEGYEFLFPMMNLSVKHRLQMHERFIIALTKS